MSDGDRARLLSLLVEHAFSAREVTLASGQKSDFYIDCKQVALRGEGHFLLGRLMFAALEALEPDGGAYAAVAGMSIGADPLCSAVSLTAFVAGRELPAIYVRKEAKGHGTGAYLEGAGAVADHSRVLLLEDVITTGGSTLRAAERVRDAGYVVDSAVCIVDRQAGGADNLAEAGIQLTSLFDKADLFAAAGGGA